VIGHGYSRHSQLLNPLAELLDVTGAVEHGIVTMEVEVNELWHSGVLILLWPLTGPKGKNGSRETRARAGRS